MKTLLSLFDYSGTWSEPYWENGWNVHQWDIKLSVKRKSNWWWQ